jgi:hypothetical protein
MFVSANKLHETNAKRITNNSKSTKEVSKVARISICNILPTRYFIRTQRKSLGGGGGVS